jgi:N-acyl-D-amino-acid deacylase
MNHAELISRTLRDQPLKHAPGVNYAYSNFGYCLLGRVIERVAGRPYGEAVAERVLRPLGIGPDALRLGRTLPDGRVPGEVAYHDAGRTGPSVFPPVGAPVPTPYGTWNLEAMDAHGGWIATAPALLRIADALDAPDRAKVIRPATAALVHARPPGAAGFEPDGAPRPAFYGLGWNIRERKAGGRNAWHTGSLPGTSTLLVRRHDGLAWAVLFNTRNAKDGQVPARLIDPLLHVAADAVTDWPDDAPKAP